MKGWMYILLCSDSSYYTGSTNDLEKRLMQHQNGEGADFTRKRLPVELIYFEEFDRVDQAFYREKQVQGWTREKKEALINREYEKLHHLAECKNETHYKRVASATLSHQIRSAQLPESATLSHQIRSVQPPDSEPRS